jgi:hypothetical protein
VVQLLQQLLGVFSAGILDVQLLFDPGALIAQFPHGLLRSAKGFFGLGQASSSTWAAASSSFARHSSTLLRDCSS